MRVFLSHLQVMLTPCQSLAAGSRSILSAPRPSIIKQRINLLMLTQPLNGLEFFYTRGFNITDGDLGKSSSPICSLWMPPPGLDRLDLFVL